MSKIIDVDSQPFTITIKVPAHYDSGYEAKIKEYFAELFLYDKTTKKYTFNPNASIERAYWLIIWYLEGYYDDYTIFTLSLSWITIMEPLYTLKNIKINANIKINSIDIANKIIELYNNGKIGNGYLYQFAKNWLVGNENAKNLVSYDKLNNWYKPKIGSDGFLIFTDLKWHYHASIPIEESDVNKINTSLVKYNIINTWSIIMFLATCAQESGKGKYVYEVVGDDENLQDFYDVKYESEIIMRVV